MVRDERSRDLQDVTLHRSHMKHDGILNLLSSAITTEHTIYPSMGQTEFFELAFTNPSSIPQTVLIQHHDAALSVRLQCFVLNGQFTCEQRHSGLRVANDCYFLLLKTLVLVKTNSSNKTMIISAQI